MQESSYLEGQDHYLKTIRRMGVFAPLGDAQLRKILSLSKIKKYMRGESILEEGTFSSWVYFLISGSAKVIKNGKKIGEIQGSGNVFGEMVILDGQKRSASVLAHRDCMCLAVDSSFLDRMEGQEKATCYAVLYKLFALILADRLRETSSELAEAKRKMSILRKKIIGCES